MMKTTKLTPSSKNAVIINSFEINIVMGLIEESFMVVSYGTVQGIFRYPAFNLKVVLSMHPYYRCSEVGINQSSANEKNLYG